LSDLPIAFHYRGEPIPDLGRIARADWQAALEPLTEEGRTQACKTAPDALEARSVVIEMELDEFDRGQEMARTVAQSASIPAPEASTHARERFQVNVRLNRRDHGRLAEAAAVMGATPTQLARIFIVNGTRRALHDAQSGT
jgi:hypothetical protein